MRYLLPAVMPECSVVRTKGDLMDTLPVGGSYTTSGDYDPTKAGTGDGLAKIGFVRVGGGENFNPWDDE